MRRYVTPEYNLYLAIHQSYVEEEVTRIGNQVSFLIVHFSTAVAWNAPLLGSVEVQHQSIPDKP